MHKTLALLNLTLTLSLSAWMAPAHALDIAAYSAQTLMAKQQAGETVGLHFHAAWCPTCRAQEKVFNTFKDDATVPGTLLVVDYDQERELKREMGVRSQSTLIIYKGKEQKHRSGGQTDAQALRAAWLSAK
ncbi:thioredoxin family protein [Limnohabitans sp. DM1]|uniref:thioredoxin family protein n=1 Tax=Limnohabitans sp. DM1 TaxID=1597955 RepID=UPI000ACCB6CD|nr:thioredoxin family protein [Limnohabitans sp. DM1]